MDVSAALTTLTDAGTAVAAVGAGILVVYGTIKGFRVLFRMF